MKILVLFSIVIFLAMATTVFAAFVYWGHPSMGVSRHQSGLYVTGDNSGAFGGCPYLQKLHEGIEPNGGDYSYHEIQPWVDPQGPENPAGESGFAPQQKILEI